MPPRIQSIEVLRAHFQAAPISNAKMQKENELRKMYQRFENVKHWLETNGHGGRIVLPLPPNLTNGYLKSCHWSYRNELKDAYKGHCDVLLDFCKLLPSPPKSPPQKAICGMSWYLEREMDDTNLSARKKWPEDWLVARGYLFDDSPSHLQYVKETPLKVSRSLVRVAFHIESTKGTNE